MLQKQLPGPVTPGCGCDEALVTEVVEEMKRRQQGRGDQGQIQRQEAMMEEIEAINNKLDAIMEHLKMDRGDAMKTQRGS